MIVAACRETFPGERRVALVPAVVAGLVKAGMEVRLEAGAGEAAGFPDADYVARGAKIVATREEVFAADVVFQVRALGANLAAGRNDLALLRSGQVLLAMCDPLGEPKAIAEVAETGATMFALELVPRITRAQAMDVLSSMATVAGYRAVLLAAMQLPQMFPMITYAAGMLRPTRVFVIGAGVAGLRAIATARQLGAVVQAHDIRPSSREEVQSVGAKFVELKIEGSSTEDKGGYAKAMDEAFYQKQRELIADVAHESDVVITTAAIPGRRSPLLVTAAAVERMPAGSVIVDMGAERGGNCELTKADERVVAHGVTILGPTNLPSEVPGHASTMYANNLVKFLLHLVKENRLHIDREDEITAGAMVTQGGRVVHPRILSLLGIDEPAAETPPGPSAAAGDADATGDAGSDASAGDDASSTESGSSS